MDFFPPPSPSARQVTTTGIWPTVRGHLALHTLMRYLVIVLSLWVLASLALSFRPTVNLSALQGVYPLEGTTTPFRWTSDQVQIPLYSHSGPTSVEIALSRPHWTGEATQPVTLTTDVMPLGNFVAQKTVRHYKFLLPSEATWLRLTTTLHRPARGDPRWLGVPLFDLRATASGLPMRAARDGLLLALALLPLIVVFAWAWHRGLGALAGITALALVLRCVLLDRLPPGFSADEVVSVVDAWHLAHTAHDHLGHLLPLGAFEAFGDWISPLLTYLEVPFVTLFGPVMFAGRLVTALVGTLTVLAGYALVRALALPRAAALLTALVVALSPWQIFLSRRANPPALVPLAVTLCLWAGVRFIKRGDRATALWLAVVGGLALYAYPTLKMLIPLLVGLAVMLAVRRHGWTAVRRWWQPALLLALIWLPFMFTTLFNPYSNMRLSHKVLRADAVISWVSAWSKNYLAYLRPDFYYRVGDPLRHFSNGVQLMVEAPLVLLGLGALIGYCVLRAAQANEGRKTREVWWFIAGAVLLAGLPASLTAPNPHLYRGASVAPIYALLVGLGGAVVWWVTTQLRHTTIRRVAQGVLAVALITTMLWQSGQWLIHYSRDYSAALARAYQDGLYEAFQRAVTLAPQFDEVWVDGSGVHEASIYLLATLPLPPDVVQSQTVARHAIGHFTLIRRVGPYQFDPPGLKDVPRNLPALTVSLGTSGNSGYVLQAWHSGQRRVLILRPMR